MFHKTKASSINSKAGFTLLEILLVVGIISILAGIVILAINPTKQLGDTRNAQRRSDVLTILNAVYQYAIDPGNKISDLAGGDLDTAKSADDDCADDANSIDTYGLDGDLVGTEATYLTAIPIDPVDGVADTSSGYFIHLNSTTGRLTVCAPSAESGVTISVTR